MGSIRGFYSPRARGQLGNPGRCGVEKCSFSYYTSGVKKVQDWGPVASLFPGPDLAFQTSDYGACFGKTIFVLVGEAK